MVQADLREPPVGGGGNQHHLSSGGSLIQSSPSSGLLVTHWGLALANGPLVTLIVLQRGHSSRPCPKKPVQVLQRDKVGVQLGPRAVPIGVAKASTAALLPDSFPPISGMNPERGLSSQTQAVFKEPLRVPRPSAGPSGEGTLGGSASRLSAVLAQCNTSSLCCL